MRSFEILWIDDDFSVGFSVSVPGVQDDEAVSCMGFAETDIVYVLQIHTEVANSPISAPGQADSVTDDEWMFAIQKFYRVGHQCECGEEEETYDESLMVTVVR